MELGCGANFLPEETLFLGGSARTNSSRVPRAPHPSSISSRPHELQPGPCLEDVPEPRASWTFPEETTTPPLSSPSLSLPLNSQHQPPCSCWAPPQRGESGPAPGRWQKSGKGKGRGYRRTQDSLQAPGWSPTGHLVRAHRIPCTHQQGPCSQCPWPPTYPRKWSS